MTKEGGRRSAPALPAQPAFAAFLVTRFFGSGAAGASASFWMRSRRRRSVLASRAAASAETIVRNMLSVVRAFDSALLGKGAKSPPVMPGFAMMLLLHAS